MSGELDRAVEIMDRLRSPGGCPWDARQTHESLTRYLVEETYEVLEAIETGDAELLREELGDLLLQVLFHARLGQELPARSAFGIDDVARDLADKLVRRHPHVFAVDGGGDDDRAGGSSTDLEALNDAWERQKITEKQRTSAVDGVPLGQPALALAAKLMSRGRRAGLDRVVDGAASAGTPGSGDADETAVIGARLLAVVADAVAADVDPEGALRQAARALRARLVEAEGPPHNER